MSPSIHPLIDGSLHRTSSATTDGSADDFKGGVLRCHCQSSPVEVTLGSNVAFNHACGCSKCWRPDGALFSVIGVVPTTALSVSADPAHKLKVVDDSATIQRYACADCGVHMYGRIEKDHAFKGFDFVHIELSAPEQGDLPWQEPQFAAFVSSVIEQGLVAPSGMEELRSKLRGAGLETYDALNPPLMDALATFEAKKRGVLAE